MLADITMTETAMNKIISDIIATRKGKVGALQVKMKELVAIHDNLEKLLQKSKSVREDASFQKMWDYNPWLQTMMNEPKEVQECAAHYAVAIEELDHLITRYNRDSVNIAVVGDSRAGKSLLLRKISGLDNDCIPSFKGTSCTGVSSVIENEREFEPQQVRAVITFKTEEEILKEINDKLEEFTDGVSRFGTLAELGRQSAEQLKSQMEETVKKGQMGHIADFIDMYVKHFTEWKEDIQPTGSELDTREKIFTDRTIIQKYVAKHNGGDQENGGMGAEYFYKYIAVKKAVIYCRFELTEVNRLRLVDTVGLGDTVDGGTIEKMYAALDAESDAALYLFRPHADQGGMINDWTYNILNEKLYPRYENADMEKWMGVVVNYDGTNWIECSSFLEEFRKKAPEMEQNVAFKNIINVGNEKEVREKGLIPLLESLSKNLRSIDARIEQRAKSLVDTANEAFAELKKGCREIRVPTQEDLIFGNRKKIFSDFVSKVRSLSEGNDNLKDEFLKNSLNEVEALKKTQAKNDNWMDKKEPNGAETSKERWTTDDICRMFNYAPAPSSRQYLAFGELQRMVRQIGSREDKSLDNEEKRLKKELAKCFLESFHFETSKCPAPESETFFSEMAEQLFGGNEDLQMLKDAFLSVHAFKLNETKGVTKILFNESANKYLNCETVEQKNVISDAETDNTPRPSYFELPLGTAAITQQPVSDASERRNRRPALQTDGGQRTGDSEIDTLVQKMDRQLELFVEDIKQSPLYKIVDLIPLSQQIAAELQYFLHFFDVCYQVEWTIVMNQQLQNGNMFASDKEKMDNLSEKFERLKLLANQTVVKARIPQNILTELF